MSPDTVSKAVVQPGVIAERGRAWCRPVTASPREVRAVVDAAVLTGDRSSISADNPAKVTPATLTRPGVWTNEVIARWPFRPYHRLKR